jgi:hypothetical protein
MQPVYSQFTPLASILSQLNPVHILTPDLISLLILSSSLRSVFPIVYFLLFIDCSFHFSLLPCMPVKYSFGAMRLCENVALSKNGTNFWNLHTKI